MASLGMGDFTITWNSCQECPRYMHNHGKCIGESEPGACVFRTKSDKKSEFTTDYDKEVEE